MSLSKVLNDLRRGVHMLDGDVRSFVLSEDFERAVAAAESDLSSKVFLTVRALDGIALDPLAGTEVSAHLMYGEHSVFCNVRFHGWSNFIGAFSLPVNDPRLVELEGAIHRNMAGHTFKAAKMYRRLHTVAMRQIEGARRAASKAYDSVITELYQRARSLTDGDRAQAREAYDFVFEPSKNRVLRRMASLNRAATPGFQGGYTESVAAFMYAYLPVPA